jgi:alkylation response protein AidB-like acyl-CoA dehydrogenase
VDFDLSEDQRTIKRTAREFLSARYKLDEVRRLALEEPDGFTSAQWDEIAGLGWPELADPEQGLGTVELAVVSEELGYALAPSPLQSTWAARALLAVGGRSDALGDGRRGTVAMWDADEVGDPDTSVLDPGADGTLHGTKIAVPDAGFADVLVVTAAGGRHFLVEAGAPGVGIVPSSSIDPTRRLFEVTLDGVRGELLDGEPEAFGRAWHAIAIATAAESVGVAERAMEMSVAYAKDRKQFDRPIGTYQAVSHRCAQMLLEVEGARSLVYWAAWALDFEPEIASVAASSAKAYASDCGSRVTGSAIQVHGGIGFTWEHDLQFFFKRAAALAHHYGDARWHRDQVAAAVLGA